MNLRTYSLTSLLLGVVLCAACAPSTNPYTNHGLRELLNAQTTLTQDDWTPLLTAPLTPERCTSPTVQNTSNPSTLLALTESCNAQGFYTVALEAAARLTITNPAHTLTPWALAHTLELTNKVPNPHAFTADIVKAVQNAKNPHVLTRIYTAHLHVNSAYEDWKNAPLSEERAQPFQGSSWGVPTQWRTVGPTSLYPNLDLDTKTTPENDTSLKDSYTLLGFERDTKTLQSSPYSITPSNPSSGIYVAQTWFNTTKPTRLDIAASFSSNAVVFVNGTPILKYDNRAQYTPSNIIARGVELSSGNHQITVRYAQKRGISPNFKITLLPEDPKVLQGAPRKNRGETSAPGFQTPWVAEPFNISALRDNPAKLFLAARLSSLLDHQESATKALNTLLSEYPSSALVHLLNATSVRRNATLPYNTRQRASLLSLRAALKADPNATHAHLLLGTSLREQNLYDAAQKHLQTFVQERPSELSGWLELARFYDARGLTPKRESALQQATKIAPEHCPTATLLQNAWLARDYMPKPSEAPPSWETCDYVRWRASEQLHANSLDTTHADRHLMALQRETARFPHQTWAWLHLARTQLELKDRKSALETIDNGLKYHPKNLDMLLQKVELLLGDKKLQPALEALQVAQTHHPSSRSTQRLNALLNNTLPLQDLYVNGVRAIQEFEKTPQRIQSSAIFILDYMARRYFEDGSSTDVTHIVVKVLDKEGLNSQGEVQLPRGAIPLMMRTIKRNGAVVEPSPDQSKPTISMPSVDVGDYIEYAYLTYNGRSPIQKGALIGASFYFQMSNIASARSEFVVEYPSSWNPKIIRRNNPPEPNITAQDGRTRMQFVKTGANQPRPEPRSVPNAEYLPHVQLLHKISWEDSRRFTQDTALVSHALSGDLIDKAHALTASLQNDTERTRALFEFAKKHVRSRSFSDFDTPAAHILKSNTGNPVVLLKALLKAIDIPSNLVQIKSQTQDPTETAIPATNLYNITALRVTADQSELWLFPDGPNAIFNYLPVFAQNSLAYSIERGTELERFRTPVWSPEKELRDVQIDIAFDAKGNLTGTVRETLQGYRAVKRRDRYEELASKENIRKFVERILNYDFNGAELLEYTIGGDEDPEAPLVLSYRFKRPGYARYNADGSIVTEDRYDLLDVTRTFARLPSRTVPMLIQNHTSIRTRVTLSTPPNFSISGPGGADSLSLNSTFGDYQRTIQRAPGKLTMEHILTIPIQRIAPDQYPTFRSWAGDLDRATYGRIIMRP